MFYKGSIWPEAQRKRFLQIGLILVFIALSNKRLFYHQIYPQRVMPGDTLWGILRGQVFDSNFLTMKSIKFLKSNYPQVNYNHILANDKSGGGNIVFVKYNTISILNPDGSWLLQNAPLLSKQAFLKLRLELIFTNLVLAYFIYYFYHVSSLHNFSYNLHFLGRLLMPFVFPLLLLMIVGLILSVLFWVYVLFNPQIVRPPAGYIQQVDTNADWRIIHKELNLNRNIHTSESTQSSIKAGSKQSNEKMQGLSETVVPTSQPKIRQMEIDTMLQPSIETNVED